MIKTTRWHPDTCDCIIEYDWDTDQPEDSRTHTVKRVVRACAAHQAHPNKETHHATVLDENVRKNKVHGILLQQFPELEGRKDDIKFSFDQSRKLKVEVKGMKKADKDLVKALADTSFGNGKVELV